MCLHYFFYSIVTPQFAIDLDKRKSNVNTFILLVQDLVCIFSDVTAGECNVFTLIFFYSIVTPQCIVEIDKKKKS